MQGERQLGPEQPVERDERVVLRFSNLEPGEILELVRAPIIGPYLDGQAGLGEHARDEVLGQDLEVIRAALEAGNQNQDRVGLRSERIQAETREAGVVDADVGAAELREQLRVRDRYIR